MSSKNWLRAVAPDVTPLKDSRSYRLLWLGQLVSVTGSQLRHAIVAYHIYQLTDSTFAVGLVGAFQAGPLIAFSLWGGVIADAVDRRRLLVFTQIGLIGVMVALAIGTQTGIAGVWYIYLLTAVAASLFALDAPARQSLIPTLVERHQIPAAMALNQVLFQTAQILGPALGGLVIAKINIAAGYWIDAATFGAGLWSVVLMKTPARSPGGTRPGIKSLMEGLRYLRSNEILWSTMAIDFLAMFFGWPRALFPYYADKVFNAGPQGYGLLTAAPGIGALVGALTAGWATRIRYQGAAVIGCVAVWGLAIAGFGLLRGSFVVALILLAIAGAADVFSAIFRGTIVQMGVPDQLRGRITSVNLMVVISGPRLGEVESGMVAGVTSPRFSAISGGLVTVLAAIGAFFLIPRLRRYKVDPEEVRPPPVEPD